MNKWYKCVCLSLWLCVCPLGQLRLNKQLCLWSKEEPQGSSVYWSISAHRHTKCSHARTEIHTHECPVLLIFYLPRSVAYLTPGVFYSLSFPLPPLLSARSLSDREECHFVWPLTHTKEGCCFRWGSEGAAAVMCLGLKGNARTHSHALTHTYTESQVSS